jgi:putative FmdB family regulatory protein
MERKIMPMYDYQCHKCGHSFEEHRPIAFRDKEYPCSNCKKGVSVRVLAGKLNFVLKGDCWARDGYVRGSDYEKEL